MDRRFYLLPAVVVGFLLQHAVQGWCPPMPVFRRLGVRTASEIEEERYALKALRGDFRGVSDGDGHDTALVGKALLAVRRWKGARDGRDIEAGDRAGVRSP